MSYTIELDIKNEIVVKIIFFIQNKTYWSKLVNKYRARAILHISAKSLSNLISIIIFLSLKLLLAPTVTVSTERLCNLQVRLGNAS
jgi:hypothetical protein